MIKIMRSLSSGLQRLGKRSALLFILTLSMVNLSAYAASVQVELVDGSHANQPLAEQVVHVRELLESGRTKWRARSRSDASGFLSLDLEGLGEGRQYYLYAKSSHDNRYRRSELLEQPGAFRFQVGSPLLKVRLLDALAGNTLPGVKLSAYYLDESGKRRWVGKASSDAEGVATFDIPALQEERPVFLRHSYFNNMRFISEPVLSSGEMAWDLGNTQVQVLDGADGSRQPLANHKVHVREMLADGSMQHYTRGTTDEEGGLRLTLPAGRKFILMARNTLNNRYIKSEIVQQGDDTRFVVGSSPLLVNLVEADSGKTLPKIRVNAYQLLEDGKYKWLARADTDSQGQAKFLLPVLAEGGKVELRSRVFNGAWSRSDLIEQSGEITFALGSVKVHVLDGSQEQAEPMPETVIHIREIMADGRERGFARAKTDADGVLRLDLPGLEQGRQYRLLARSPQTSRYKKSQIISDMGEHKFLVGTPLLKVRLFNAFSGEVLPEQKVRLYQQVMMDGASKLKYLGSANTDVNGHALLDSAQLEETELSFVVGAKPYNAGLVKSPVFAGGTRILEFPVGTMPLTLSDRDTGKALAGKRVNAYQVMDDNRLKHRKKGTTDGAGQINFDLETLEPGTRHIFRVSSPFGNNKRYFSQIITAKGPVEFAVSIEDKQRPDLTVPELAIVEPMRDQVGSNGFELSGTAQDNTEIAEVQIRNSTTDENAIAEFDVTSGVWKYAVSPNWLSVGSELKLTVIAVDQAGNTAETHKVFEVVADQEAPQLQVLSHENGEQVTNTGFVLKGSASDDTGVEQLKVSLQQGSAMLLEQDLRLDPTGNWAFVVPNGVLAANSPILLSLSATDAHGQVGNLQLQLEVIGAASEARQLLNRITFGATPELLKQVREIGPAAFLEQQLNPNSINDAAFQEQLEEIDLFTNEDLQTYSLLHMVASPRQLQEVMTWFWDNHFNTDLRKDGNTMLYELAENDVFRANALGNFANLLEASAKSPAMLIYLDNVANVAADANENYARELLELHTVGVDGGYTQSEVEALAEVFTGWQVRDDQFYFNADEHNASDKEFWGYKIPGGGVEEGEMVLAFLASHPATAEYICGKLITLLVSDQPVAELSQRCAVKFQATATAPDQIAQVLRLILTAPEFNQENHFNNKFRTPLEFGVATVRALAATGDVSGLASEVQRMGIRLYHNPVPTGWSEEGEDWISTGLLQERLRFVNRAVNGQVDGVEFDPVSYFRERGVVTAESVLAEMFDLLMNNQYSPLEWQTALGALEGDAGFDLESDQAAQRLRETLGIMLSYPAYNYQ